MIDNEWMGLGKKPGTPSGLQGNDLFANMLQKKYDLSQQAQNTSALNANTNVLNAGTNVLSADTAQQNADANTFNSNTKRLAINNNNNGLGSNLGNGLGNKWLWDDPSNQSASSYGNSLLPSYNSYLGQ